ncbi:MAG: hypothetical protein WC453_01490 [Patescibacteria group bacterium]
MNNKHRIAILIGGLILIIILAILIWSGRLHRRAGQPPVGSLPAVEFMTDQEKAAFNIPADLKAQVITREAGGDISVYKIISSDADIVTDPAAVPPISPRQQAPIR